MAQKLNSFERFWKELKRRKVIHVITVYAAVSFVILQLVDIVEQPLRLPDWTTALVIVLLCIGFVISVFISWVYDITPKGVKKTKPISELKHVDHTTYAVSDGWRIATYVSGVIIIALIAFNFISKRNLNADISKLEKSIAVLPFVNDSPSDSNQYFINGIMEEVLNNLMKIKDLRVLSRTSTAQYAGSDKPTIPEIAKKLNVNYIIEGSGQKYGNTFILSVQLIADNKEKHLWGESYEEEIREVRDYVRIRNRIARAIASELKAIITPEEKQQINKVPTDNLEAYNLYLKGTYFYQKMTREGLKEASEYFKEALRKDPNFALAYIGLSQFNSSSTFWGNVPPDEGIPKANEYVKNALKIDSTLAEAYWQLGNINTFYNWNWKEAEGNYRHAIKLNPNSSLIHTDYSNLLTITGRHNEAISEAKRAQELDPLSTFIIARTGAAYAYNGQYDKAIEQYRISLTMDPDYFYAHFELANAYLAKEMINEAIAEYEKSVDLSNENPFITAILICNYYGNGKTDRAEKLFESLKKRSETDYIPPVSFFLIYRFRGEEDLATDWLKKALTEHDTFLPMLKNNSGIFPEGSGYLALLRKAGLD
jgi:adenylate cyclase